MLSKTLVAIPGSNRPLPMRTVRLRSAAPKERITVSIYVRENPNPPSAHISSLETTSIQLPEQRAQLSQAHFDAIHGADPDELARIAAYAKSKKLKVVDSSISKRRIQVEGPVRDINRAFGVSLQEYKHPDMGRYRGREGSIHLPTDLVEIVDGVFGLDTRPVGHSRIARSRMSPQRFATARRTMRTARAATSSPPTNPWPGTFFPPEIASLYNFPSETDGTGQNVAVFAFNGDSHGGYSTAALKTYFEKVLGGSMPSITDRVVHGPGNDPGPDTRQSQDQGDTTGEIMLDLCVLGSIAPAAKLFVYFTVFTSQGWVDALHDAIHDPAGVSVISISYGNPEDDPTGAWTPMGVRVANAAFRAAAARNITVCCASGDDGSSDQSRDGRAHTDFPASSPYVLGVGGTTLRVSSTEPARILDEVVWNKLLKQEGAGGGGVSNIFSKPTYQNNAGVPPAVDAPHRIGRGVPDVAAVADPHTGVVVMRIDGAHLQPIGGTSAAAPLWAGLIARLNQALGSPCGFMNPLLYTKFASGVLRDITSGDNGRYRAGSGWDACTGLGTPDGRNLLLALRGQHQPAPRAVDPVAEFDTHTDPRLVVRTRRLVRQQIAAERIARVDTFRARLRGADARMRVARDEYPDADISTSKVPILAEGDSWFDYPQVLLTGGGVITHLEDIAKINALNLAHHGDAVQQMMGAEQYDRLRDILLQEGQNFKAILFSGGGNDIVGEQLRMWLKDRAPGMTPTQAVDSTRVAEILDIVKCGYLDLMDLRDRFAPGCPIFVHGYAFPKVTGKDVCGIGPWLRPSLISRGWTDPADQFSIVKSLLQRFGDILRNLASVPENRVTFVDAQSLLNPDTDWDNELHPNSDGFDIVARAFKDALLAAGLPV